MTDQRGGYYARLEVTGPNGETFVLTGLRAEKFNWEMRNGEPYNWSFPFPGRLGPITVELLRFDFENLIPTEAGEYYTITTTEGKQNG